MSEKAFGWIERAEMLRKKRMKVMKAGIDGCMMEAD